MMVAAKKRAINVVKLLLKESDDAVNKVNDANLLAIHEALTSNDSSVIDLVIPTVTPKEGVIEGIFQKMALYQTKITVPLKYFIKKILREGRMVFKLELI